MPFCCGQCGVMNSCFRPQLRTSAVNLRLVKTSRLSDLRRNSAGTRPNVPNLVINACSRAVAAVVALPERDRCQPSNSRVWQSISEEGQKTVRVTVFPANASVAQPSRPARTRHMSVDQRSFGALATDGIAPMRGRMPTGRLRI